MLPMLTSYSGENYTSLDSCYIYLVLIKGPAK